MNISLTLTEEQADCLNDFASAQGVTAEEFCASLVMSTIDNITNNAYESSVSRLGEAARGLPYEARKQLIADVAAQLQS